VRRGEGEAEERHCVFLKMRLERRGLDEVTI
jgi:hypothetical protein